MDILKRASGRVVEVETMSRNRRKIRTEICIRNIGVVLRVHRLRLVDRVRAIATAEGQVFRAVGNDNGLGVA